MRIVRYTYPTNRISPASLFARSPWAGLETEIDRLFSSALTDFATPALEDRFPVDLYEDTDNTYLRAELPGVQRDAITVEVVDGFLNIQATRHEGKGDDKSETKISRSLNLPEDVKSDGIKARYEDGVLSVTLPKKEEAKPRKVSVTVD